MPKKATGYTPNKSKSNPISKQDQPMKAPVLKKQGLPQALKAPNAVATLPKLPSISRPKPLPPRTPKI